MSGTGAGSETGSEVARETGLANESENEQLLIHEGFVERHAFTELLSSEILNGTLFQLKRTLFTVMVIADCSLFCSELQLKNALLPHSRPERRQRLGSSQSRETGYFTSRHLFFK